jgi:hypothetical protein
MRTLEEIRQKNKRKDLLLDGMKSAPKKDKNILKRIKHYIERKKLKRLLLIIKKGMDKIFRESV